MLLSRKSVIVIRDRRAMVRMDLRPVGFVRSPYKTVSQAPHQGRDTEQESEIVIRKKYAPGLLDVEHHPHLIVLCWFDRADRSKLTATPPHLSTEHGVFATRSPHRPNPIGFCVVDLVERDGCTLRVRGLDAIDGTPVLDIKPYSRGIDCVPGRNARDRV
jgi:formylmethanofuran dehydrogenase subunit E